MKGITFVAIDIDKPLSEQGPFDVVLHKVIDLYLDLFFLLSELHISNY